MNRCKNFYGCLKNKKFSGLSKMIKKSMDTDKKQTLKTLVNALQYYGVVDKEYSDILFKEYYKYVCTECLNENSKNDIAYIIYHNLLPYIAQTGQWENVFNTMYNGEFDTTSAVYNVTMELVQGTYGRSVRTNNAIKILANQKSYLPLCAIIEELICRPKGYIKKLDSELSNTESKQIISHSEFKTFDELKSDLKYIDDLINSL